MVSSVFVRALIALLAAIRLASLHNSAGVSGLNLLLAFWTVGSPWVLGYASNAGALLNNVIAAVFVAVLAVWSAGATVVAQKLSAGQGRALRDMG